MMRKLNADKFAFDFLEENYEKTDDCDDMIDNRQMIQKLNNHLKSLDKKPFSKQMLIILIKKIFGEIAQIQIDGVIFYGNLKEKTK